MCALAPLAAMASRSARIVAGCGPTTSGTTTAEGAPAGRRAAASARTARIPVGSPRPPLPAARRDQAGLRLAGRLVARQPGERAGARFPAVQALAVGLAVSWKL